MPNWKKVVVSGSNAHLSEVTSSDGIKTTTINASGTITGNSFSGDGSSLSGVSNFSISNASESRFVLTNGDGTAGEATSNMSEGGSFIHISKDFLGNSANGFRYYAGDSDGPGPTQAAIFGYSTTWGFMATTLVILIMILQLWMFTSKCLIYLEEIGLFQL